MKTPTIYSALCSCCGSTVLATRPITALDAEKGVVSIDALHGDRFIADWHEDYSDLVTVYNERGDEMRMLLPDAEMWLIHGET